MERPTSVLIRLAVDRPEDRVGELVPCPLGIGPVLDQPGPLRQNLAAAWGGVPGLAFGGLSFARFDSGWKRVRIVTAAARVVSPIVLLVYPETSGAVTPLGRIERCFPPFRG